MNNYIEWNGTGQLIHENFGLNETVEWQARFSLSEAVSKGNLLTLKIKMPGTAISSPHELPFENFRLEGKDDKSNLPIIFNQMFLSKWQEVYYYSYAMEFSAASVDLGDFQQIDKLEFFIPNLLIGYDKLSLGEELVNSSEIKINSAETEYQLTLSGNPKFNDSKNFNSIEAQTDLTTTLTVTAENQPLDYLKTLDMVNTFINLLSFAYGSYRPWLLVKGYKNNTICLQHSHDLTYFDNSNNIAVIPVKFSSELSNFITTTFTKFSQLENSKSEIFNRLFADLGKATLKISFPGSLILLGAVLNSFSTDYLSGSIIPDILSEKLNNLFSQENVSFEKEWLEQFTKRLYEITSEPEYREGDYKIFFRILSLVHLFVLKSLDYNGKYWDWSGVSPVIRENII